MIAFETANSANLMSFEFIYMVDYCYQAEYATDDLPRPHKKKKKLFNTV